MPSNNTQHVPATVPHIYVSMVMLAGTKQEYNHHRCACSWHRTTKKGVPVTTRQGERCQGKPDFLNTVFK